MCVDHPRWCPNPRESANFQPLMTKREDALDYHASGRPGKIAVVPTKPLNNQRDLALAYTPGVAVPCLEIETNPDDAYKYTAKGNLVAVVTNGTAVLGLGNIGALAAKPVMEGKANLFKQFADLDVFDLEVGSENPDDVIRFCQLLEPTVGGINLEDIRAPDCFYIEETLRKTMKIPVFHDDQHGTAIISGAALLNALEIVGKEHRGRQGGVLRRRCGRDLHRRALRAARRAAREHPDVRPRGRDPRGPRGPHRSVQGPLQAQDLGAHAEGRAGRRRRLRRPVRQGRSDRRHGRQDGAEPDHLRARESRSRDPAGRGARRARRRDHRDRPQRLSRTRSTTSSASRSSSAARSTCAPRRSTRR